MKKYDKSLLDAVEYCELVDIFAKRKSVSTDNPIYNKNPLCRFWVVEIGTSFALVSIEEKRIVVCFQGTDDLPDVARDLNAIRNDMDISRGVYRVAEKYFSRLCSIFKNNPDKTPCFFGHSLGGAIAIALSYLVSKNLDMCVKTISFGSQKIGGKIFKEDFNGQRISAVRYEIDRDIVPDLAPESLGFTYECRVVKLNDKSWYKLKLPFIRTKIHLDYYSNVRKWS